MTNFAQAQLARQWSWAARAVLPNRYRHVRAHAGVADNEFADVGAELGRRLRCTSFLRLCVGHSLRKEWWTDQLSKPDPLTDRGVARPSATGGLELQRVLGQCSHNSPATDELEVHSVRRMVSADAFSKKHIDVVGGGERGFARGVHAQFDNSCLWWFFHVITSAGVSRQGGVDIWVRKCLCDASDIFVFARHGENFSDSCLTSLFPILALLGPRALRASGSARRGSLDGKVGAW